MSSIIFVGAVWSLAVCANIWYIESNGRVPPWVPDVNQGGDYQSLLSKMHRKHSKKVIRGLCKNRTIPRIISNPYSSDSSGTTVQRCSKCKWIHSPFFSSQRQPGLHGGTIDLPTIFRICESFEHEPWQKWHPESSKSPLSWSMVTRLVDKRWSWQLDFRLSLHAQGFCLRILDSWFSNMPTWAPPQLLCCRRLHLLRGWHWGWQHMPLEARSARIACTTEGRRETQRERETDRPTDRRTDRQPASQTHAGRQAERRTDRHRDRDRKRQKETERERDRKRQKEKETERQKQKETETERDRNRKRQKQKETETDRKRQKETERNRKRHREREGNIYCKSYDTVFSVYVYI